MTTWPARHTYDAAVDHFDAPSIGFWDRYGSRTIERLRLSRGARVLDVAAGAGGSALPAARAVGPTGSVIAFDISPALLELAQRKATRAGLVHVTTRVGDMTKLDREFAPRSFDAVVIVFGLFFAPDMIEQVRTLARLVRPGGQLAITTWATDLFAPLHAPFLDAVRRERPDLEPFRPWDRLTTPEAMATVLGNAGLTQFEIAREPGQEPIRSPEDWWTIVLGTGLRWYLDKLPASSSEAFRMENLERAREVTSIETNVIYATARIQGDDR